MNARRNPALLAALAAILAAGCQPVGSEKFEAPFGTAAADLTTSNGLSLNGLSANGLSANGLSRNGLSRNGLSPTTLGTTAFRDWFNADPALGDLTMRYLVRCAAPASQTVTWTNSVTGKAYSWAGGVGVAASYAQGNPPTLAEQQLITACVLAHVNKYGNQVSFAVEGRTATGELIPQVSHELNTYAFWEGAFFGNIFDSTDGIYVCSDDFTSISREYSSLRACAFSYSTKAASDGCAPMTMVGPCSSYCTLDSSLSAFGKCTYNGRTYLPITTAILPADVYRCGDRVCQATEKCGNGRTFDSCRNDCGLCP